ncbi:MAG: asparagine--tRNA ligase [Legionellales bacterium]|jgi:asparaginyl-tRNA synthetase
MTSAIKIYDIAALLTNKVATGTIVTIHGWVKTKRDSKAGFSFIALSDGSCFNPIQIVAEKSLENYDNEISHLTTGCAITATGELVPSQGKGQSVEIKALKIEIVGLVDDPDSYPIAAKYHTLEYLREYAHLRVRTNVIGAVTRVQHCLAQAMHRFFDERGFFWIRTPIITANDCEGAGQQFRVSTLDLANLPRTADGNIDYTQDFFGTETFLTVSGQLQAESYALAMSKVYTFGPTFRAENSNTARHLAEFWMLEPEIAFADLNANAALAEDLLKYLAINVLEKRADDMSFFADRIDKECINRLEALSNSKFAHMDYTDAITELQKSNKKFEFPVYWGCDLQSEHERYLTEEVIKGPIIMMNYPKEIKSFYMRLNDDGKTVAAMDVLVPGVGEIMGGSQREERLDVLGKRLEIMCMNKDLYQWYLDLRRYGTVPHAGFGLGFERLVRYVTGMENIRDVIPFPRTQKHAKF